MSKNNFLKCEKGWGECVLLHRSSAAAFWLLKNLFQYDTPQRTGTTSKPFGFAVDEHPEPGAFCV